ncbi:PA2779 family protein [Marinimicrobium alkaliphilum]|uniref:PA2779 family protein n=1 Tax=Marinimicrobium alkaliphilum TaxID=2202654 RepID=UPI000DBA5805|nr:PA2779 family protein [Marinimicrobium alkaliphilum]
MTALSLTVRRLLFIACAFMLIAAALPSAQADIVGTQDLVMEHSGERQQLLNDLNRDDIRAELERFGVNPDQAQERVAAMTDTEVMELSAGLDQFAAGGSVVTVLLILILVILLT